jgi:hypothetical protein
MLAATSGIEVKVASTIVPCSSATREARSIAIAPPS